MVFKPAFWLLFCPQSPEATGLARRMVMNFGMAGGKEVGVSRASEMSHSTQQALSGVARCFSTDR